MASTNVIKMGWEQKFDLYEEHCVLQLKARTTTCHHANSLHLYIHNEIDHSATVKAIASGEDVVQELQIICEEDAKKHEEVMTVLMDHVKATENSGNTQEKWKIFIEAEADKAIADVTARLNESIEKVRDAIKAAPEAAHESATYLWRAGRSIVMLISEALLKQLNTVSNAFADFLGKDCKKLMEAWSNVVDTVSAGIRLIKRIFGCSEPVVPTTETTPTETEKTSESYTGRVIWKESVDFLTACAAYTKICGSLENGSVSNKLRYVIHSRVIQHSTGKPTQATVVFYCKGLDVHVDLAKVWDEHVTKEGGQADIWHIPEDDEPTTAMQEDFSHIPNGGTIEANGAKPQ